MTDGLFGCPAYKVYGKIIVDESYATVGPRRRWGSRTPTSRSPPAAAGVPLPSAMSGATGLLGAIAHGEGDQDWAVIAREQARASGLA